MGAETILWMALLMALAAALYSSVGHGGASAYLAIMALFNVAPEVMRPTALTLNLIVAGFAAWRFWSKGETSLKLLAAFAVTAVPAAFFGGSIQVPPEFYRPLVGILLWLSAVRLVWHPKELAERPVSEPTLWVTLPTGALLGLLAGVTGTGGGIFLSPLIILFAWAGPRPTAGVAAGFIFLNSLAGLAGNVAAVGSLPSSLPILAGAVAAGALLGTWLGVERLPRARLLQALALVLAIAGAKLILT